MRIRLLIFIIAGVLCSMTSCDIVNPEESIPAYLFIPEFTLNTELATEGTKSHKITEAHIFVANESVGIFSLPATVPVLAEGVQEIQIFPTKFFFEPQESFEDGTFTFAIDLDGDPATTIELTNQEVFEGNGSGLIELERADVQMELGSNLITDLPTSNRSATFLELNYKTEVSFLVGVLGYDSQGRVIYSLIDKGVNPRDDWNKIYFDFTEEVINLISLENELAGWRLVIVSDLFDGELEQANIFLDNIKLVQFR